MSLEQEFLKKCNDAFPGIDSKDELSFEELNQFMKDENTGTRIASAAQSALLKELATERSNHVSSTGRDLDLTPPANLSKLSVAAFECIRVNKNEKRRISDEEYVSKEVLPTVEQKLTETILKHGPKAWAPILKLERPAIYTEFSSMRIPSFIPPSLSSREEAVRRSLAAIPQLEVQLTPDTPVKKDEKLTMNISIRLKQKK